MHFANGGPGVDLSVGVGPDVMEWAGFETEQKAEEEAAKSVWRAGIVPALSQTAAEKSVPAAAAAAVQPMPGATVWTAEADELAGTAEGITALGS